MNTLFIDTASKDGCTALCEDHTTIASAPLLHHGDAEVVPTIEKMLNDAGKSYEDLDRIACAIGPGGFTSLRVGVTTANTLAYALDIPLAGIHLSDLWFARINEETNQRSSVMWLHSTRRTHLFARENPQAEVQLLTIEEASKLLALSSHLTAFIGELLPEHQEALSPIKPCADIRSLADILPAFLSSLPYEKRQLEPWYGREG